MAVRAVFRVAAGPRIGFGHLVRARVLARALGIPCPVLALRGDAATRRVARRLGFVVKAGMPARILATSSPDVLVIDDPASRPARIWRNAAARHRIAVTSLHDLGRAFCRADLSVDGSLSAPGWGTSGRQLIGPRFAILDPRVAAARGAPRTSNRVLLALGGGSRVSVARRLAATIRQRRQDVEVRIAGGFSIVRERDPGVVWLPPLPGLAGELSSCAVAVVAGGVSLYESAVLRTPAVIWPVVRAQHPTVHAFSRAGYGIPILPGTGRAERAATAVVALLNEPRSVPRPVPALDGLGARRVADAIRDLVRMRTGGLH